MKTGTKTNLNQLCYFYAVGRTGSYTRAADEVGVSEPVVYRAVRSLEKTCGMRLLQRKGKTISVAPEAARLFEYASRIASLSEMAKQEVAEQKGNICGRLSIGASISAVLYLLPAILPKWSREHPLIEVSLTQAHAKELDRDLLTAKVDLIISAGASWSRGLRKELVFSDKLVVVSAVGHPLAKRSLVTVSELSKEKLILTPRGSSVRDEMEEVESQWGVKFSVAAEVNRLDPVKPLCRAGMGIGVLPLSVVFEEIEQKALSLLNVEGFPRSFPYFLIYRQDNVVTPEMKSFLLAVHSWTQESQAGEVSNVPALQKLAAVPGR